MPPPNVPAGARRVVQPQGYAFWIVGDERAVLRDAYHNFLRMPWPLSIAQLALAWFVVNVIFATAYYLAGGVDGMRAGSFWDALVFSVQTLGTIGYGVMNPKSGAANTIMMIESVTSVVVTALATGLVFSKFARTTARVAFSKVVVITPHDGKPTLIFRVGNRRANAIVDAHLRVIAGFTTRTAEGQTFYKLRDLELVRDRQSGMRRGWTVMHVIDERSPLHGLDAAALAAAELELEVSLIGMDDVTMQTVHTIHTYLDTDIKFGHRFVDTMRALPDGDYVIDLRQFDAIVPDDVPHDSVAAS
ncbi:MAG TPA: ion channel [Kofleriaceae bacterium]|nr:ion channel [Kofleriaceae bacterium]